MERVVLQGRKKYGGFVHLTKVANAEKHAFYTVTLFPIFLVKNLQNSKKNIHHKKIAFYHVFM